MTGEFDNPDAGGFDNAGESGRLGEPAAEQTERRELTEAEREFGHKLYQWCLERVAEGVEISPGDVRAQLESYEDKPSVGSILRAAIAEANFRRNEAADAVDSAGLDSPHLPVQDANEVVAGLLMDAQTEIWDEQDQPEQYT